MSLFALWCFTSLDFYVLDGKVSVQEIFFWSHLFDVRDRLKQGVLLVTGGYLDSYPVSSM